MNAKNSNHISIGKLGEKIAYMYLQKKGYKIIVQNYRCRSGEIDIVALSPKRTISFVEVKCRVGTGHGHPYEAVTYSKQKKLMSAIQLYILQNKLHESKLSVEVISIILNPDKSISEIKHFDDLGMGLQETM